MGPAGRISFISASSSKTEASTTNYSQNECSCQNCPWKKDFCTPQPISCKIRSRVKKLPVMIHTTTTTHT